MGDWGSLLSYLLFLDESGHDHRNAPYEVRGGIALHASKLWPFVEKWRALEAGAFGAPLAQYRTEVKGAKLLDKDRFAWAEQASAMDDLERQKHCRAFLTKGLEKKAPTRQEFTAYGQASLCMARSIFALLDEMNAKVFAAVIPCDVECPTGFRAEEYLRKDHVFLLERFFYFLEQEREHGLLVMDEADKTEDRRFVRRLQNYFRRTQTGRYRTAWIAPSPFFVASDMTFPVQAADLCIYCINWGFRLPRAGMIKPVRQEIADGFGPAIQGLQFAGQAYRDGKVYPSYGICYVPDPYTARQGQ